MSDKMPQTDHDGRRLQVGDACWVFIGGELSGFATVVGLGQGTETWIWWKDSEWRVSCKWLVRAWTDVWGRPCTDDVVVPFLPFLEPLSTTIEMPVAP